MLLLDLDVVGRTHHPVFQFWMPLDEPLAKERDGADVFQRTGGDARRDKSFARVPEHEEIRIFRTRNRSEESGLGVAEGRDILRLEVVAEDVRHPCVVGAAYERFPIASKDESGR